MCHLLALILLLAQDPTPQDHLEQAKELLGGVERLMGSPAGPPAKSFEEMTRAQQRAIGEMEKALLKLGRAQEPAPPRRPGAPREPDRPGKGKAPQPGKGKAPQPGKGKAGQPGKGRSPGEDGHGHSGGKGKGEYDPHCPLCEKRDPTESTRPADKAYESRSPLRLGGRAPHDPAADRWGGMREADRRMREFLKKEDLPPHYRELVERYFIRLSREKD